jgi:hypothetical protein
MKIIKAALACAVICACSGSNSKQASDKLSLSVEQTATDGGVAQVDRIRMSVAAIKLEGPSADAGQVEVNEGPFLVDLSGPALAGSLQQVFDADVPAGTWREFSVNLAPAAVGGELAAQGASIIVDGTFNGAAFSFSSKLNATEKKEGSFSVGADTGNITLSFDSSGWFGTAAAPLDPTVAANAAAIEANIAASLNAFRDDDHNGHDDDSADAGHGGDDRADGGDDRGHDDAGVADGGDDHGHDDGGDDHGGGHHDGG